MSRRHRSIGALQRCRRDIDRVNVVFHSASSRRRGIAALALLVLFAAAAAGEAAGITLTYCPNAACTQDGGDQTPLGTYDDNVFQLKPPTGFLKLVYNDSTVTAPELSYKSDAREGTMSGGIAIVRADGRMQAQSLDYRLVAGNEAYHLVGDVKIQQVADGKVSRVLTGDEARYDAKTGDLDLSGHVTVQDGDRDLSADALTYSKEKHLLQMRGHVVLQQGKMVLHVDGLDYDTDSKHAILLGPTLDATIPVEQESKAG